MATNDEKNTVEILLAYGFSKEDSEKAARLAQAFIDEKTRVQMTKGQKLRAEEALKQIEDAKKFNALRVEGAKVTADKEIAEEKRVTKAAKVEYKDRLQAHIDAAKKVALVSGAIAASSTAVLYKALGFAQQYVSQTKDQTQLTERWNAANEKINQSQLRIGKVLAKEILPVLEKAADVIEKIADWAEKNPEVVSAGLKGLAAIATMATIVTTIAGTVAALGKAAQILQGIMGSGAFKSLLGSAGAGGDAFGAGAGMARLGMGDGAAAAGMSIATIAAIATSVVGGILAGGAIFNKIKEKDIAAGKADTAGTVAAKGATLAIFEAMKALRDLGYEADKTDKELWEQAKLQTGLSDATRETNDALDDAASKMSAFGDEAQTRNIVQAYSDMLRNEEQLTEQYQASINSVLEQSYRQQESMARSHAANVASIMANYNTTTSNLTASFNAANVQAQQDLQNQLADIAQQGAEQVRQIQEASQERLRKMAMEHADRVDGLVRARDALGLIKERRDYGKAVSEENRATKLQIAQARRQTQMQLAQAREAFNQAQAQRAEEYKLQMEEAAKQRDEQLEAENKQYAEQMRLLDENTQQELNALQDKYTSEIELGRKAWAQMVSDAATFAQGVTGIHAQMYANLLQQAQQAAANIKLDSSGSVVSTGAQGYAEGGYVSKSGVYRMAERGKEFVLSNQSTKVAERLVGGSLTQERLLAGIVSGIGKSVTINANQRFDSRLSVEDRVSIRNMMRQDLLTVAKGIGA